MSVNHRGSGPVYKTSEWDALEKLPPEVRKALQESVQSWGVAATMHYCRKHGSQATIAWLRGGDRSFIKKGWSQSARKYTKSPAVEAGVEPLYANW